MASVLCAGARDIFNNVQPISSPIVAMIPFLVSSLSLFACSVFIGNGFSPVFGVMKQTSRSRMPALALGLFFASKLCYDLASGVLPWTIAQYPVWLLCYFVARKSSLLSATVFFLLSNTVCFFQMNGTIPAWKMYSADWAGYCACMAAGLPYYLRSLAATAVFEILWALGTRFSIRPVVWLRSSLSTAAASLVVILLASAALAGDAPQTVYLEEFDNLGCHVDCFKDNVSITEAPASLKALSLNPPPGESLTARSKYFPIATPPTSRHFAIYFRYKMRGGPEDRRAFTMMFFTGETVITAEGATNSVRNQVAVTVDEFGSYFGKARPRRKPANGAPGFLPAHQWNKAAIVIAKGEATLYVFRNGVLTAEAKGSFPSGTFVGWNVTAHSKVDIDGVRIVDGATKPYAIGDIADWLDIARGKYQRVFGGRCDFIKPKGATVLTNGQEMAFAPGEGADFVFLYQAGPQGGMRDNRIEFALEDGSKASISFRTLNANQKATFRRFDSAAQAFADVTTNVQVAAQGTLVSGPGFRANDFSRPRMQWRYENGDILELLAGMDAIPPASNRTIRVRLHPLVSNWTTNEVWVDSRYVGQMALASPPKSATARFAGAPQLAAFPLEDLKTAFDSSRFLVLDAEGLGRPYGTLAELTGIPDIVTVPFKLARASHALNLAFCRENLGSFALECNGYLSRNAHDGLPSAMHFSVPVAQYIRAYALCAVDPRAPQDFVPTVTARLTHYLDNGGRSQAACECTRTLPRAGEALPPGVSAFGEAADGTPVFQVAFDFDIGSIQDLTSMLSLDHLDLDFVGPLWEKDNFYLSRRRSPSRERQSSVQIFAATLERTPVGLVVAPYRKNSVYYPSEKPGANVTVERFGEGEFKVGVRVTDVSGAEMFATNFPVPQAAAVVPIDFPTMEYGHYNVRYAVTTDEGMPVIAHAGAFALLPPDTRRAGYESPYYVWNFRGAHGTPRQLEDYGDMLRRMGVRRTLLSDDLCETNELVKPYMLTLGEFPYYKPRAKAGQSEEEALAEMKATMRDKLARFPHCRSALVFHESGGGAFPMELLDGTTEVTPEIAAADSNRVAAALMTARAWREVDPGVRLIYGNSGSSVGIIGQLCRGGFPKELLDALGEESVGMTQPPERSTAYPAWCLRKIARAHGYDNAQPDGPWEWKSRVVRHQGEANFAAVKVRDALIAHAWNYTCIPLCGLTEMANSYYDTIWGEGCFERWPLAYPHQCFTATATLTLLLDRAKFVRLVPTGSPTVYCMEFSKPDNSHVYALWTPRAEIPVKIDAGDGVRRLNIVDMLGGSRKIEIEEPLVVSPRPCYLSSETPLKGVAVDPAVTSAPPPPKPARPSATVVQPLADTAEVEVSSAADPRIEAGLEDPPYLCFHRPGAFAVETNELGCLSLTRVSTNACPELVQEYTFLKFPDAEPAAGRPSTIGLWVRGNSSWGKLYFEITDAEGEVWLSAGTGGYGCSVYDWPEQASINFEGWQFVEFPINGDSPVKVFSPGENEWQWQRDGNAGNGKIDYPIKVTGLGVGMYPRVLNILEMEETRRDVLIKDLCVY